MFLEPNAQGVLMTLAVQMNLLLPPVFLSHLLPWQNKHISHSDALQG